MRQKWLAAQLSHYGLKAEGTTANMKAQLQEAARDGFCKHQPDDLQELEERLKVQWVELKEDLEKKARPKHEAQYEKALTDEQRLAVDSGKFWFEKFKQSGEKTAVLKHIGTPRSSIHKLAETDGMVSYSWHMDGDPKDQEWMTIGYDRDETHERASKETELYAPTAKKILDAQKAVKDAEEREFLEKNPIARSQPVKFKSQNILGTWNITCSAIDEKASTMTLFRDPNTQKIAGKFNPGTFEGILCFKRNPSAGMPCVKFEWVGREPEDSMIRPLGTLGDGKIELSQRGAQAKLFFDDMEYEGDNVICTAVKIDHNPIEDTVDYEGYCEESRDRYTRPVT